MIGNVKRLAFLTVVTLAALGSRTQLIAQEPASVPETKAPAPTQTAPPQNAAPVLTAPLPPPPVALPSATQYNPKMDWAWLARFKESTGNDLSSKSFAVSTGEVKVDGEAIVSSGSVKPEELAGPGPSPTGCCLWERNCGHWECVQLCQ